MQEIIRGLIERDMERTFFPEDYFKLKGDPAAKIRRLEQDLKKRDRRIKALTLENERLKRRAREYDALYAGYEELAGIVKGERKC